MAAPKVIVNILDGQIGVVNPGAQPIAFVGCAPGAIVANNTPTLCYSLSQLVDALGDTGQMLDDAAFAMGISGRPILLTVVPVTTDGSAALDSSDKTGTSVASVAASPDPNGVYEGAVRITNGGTIGVAGITYQVSLDSEQTWSVDAALGTDNEFEFAFGLTIDLGSGTLVTGDIIRFRTVGPKWNAAGLDGGLAAVQASNIPYRIGVICGDTVGSDITGINTRLEAMATAGKYRAWFCESRIPNVGESMATYVAAIRSSFSASASRRVLVCVGDCFRLSALTLLEMHKATAAAVAGYASRPNVKLSDDVAAKTFGRMQGVRITANDGNPLCFDEFTIGGLDDFRLTTLRTWDSDPGGAYVCNARLHSPIGSDFQYLQHRLVMDVACETVKRALEDVLSTPVAVNLTGTTKGFITEAEALDIEEVVMGKLRTAIEVHCTSFEFKVSRTDNILSTGIMNSTLKIVPFGYPKEIFVDAGFSNPAQAAA